MIRILLIGEALRSRSFNGANKALPVLASALRNAGFRDVLQLDLERGDVTIEDVCRAAVRSDLVAFAGCMSPQWPELDVSAARVCDALLQAGREDVPVIVGGYAAKGVEDIARASPWISAFFEGEGEDAMPRIAELVAAGRFPEGRAEVQGLCYVAPDGRFHRSTAPRVANFDAIDQGLGFVHVPAVHDMDIFRAPDGRQLKSAQLFTQRGCPWRCGYCNKSTEGGGVARLGEASLRDQLESLRAQGFEAVYLDVDTFTVNRAAAEREARLLGESGLKWGSNTRIDMIDAGMMQHFVAHGCDYMFFGVEHIDPGVGLAIGKFNGSWSTQLRDAENYPSLVVRAFADMRAARLPSSYFIILGLPKAVLDESGSRVVAYRPTDFEEDIAAIRFGIERCEPDYLNLNVLRFMPGSAAADAPHHPAYSCVRPSGAAPITAGYFLPRVAEARGYTVPRNHPVYRLCESVGLNQPTTTALDPERVHRTVETTMRMVNAHPRASGRPAMRLFIERDLFEAKLVGRDEDDRYWMAPLREWEGYEPGADHGSDRAAALAFERLAHAGGRPAASPARTVDLAAL
ncbi:B12-binding domain-containing radical SAM protein [Methylobacterium sp. sgz302541]|uniref:B12-binding domain-containing radical SAM protein n=1 Tax=unclassified Methylobacterium TaxID=2615210 RepID=UPI003D34F7B1